MALFQNLTQFAPLPNLGQPMKGVQPFTFPMRINPASVATGLSVGTPLKLFADTSTSEIVVDLATLSTDKVFAIIPGNTKKNTYAAGDLVDGFAEGNTLMLEATAAINAGSFLVVGNTSAAGGGPGVTPTTVAGTQYGAIALASVSAGATAILVQVKGGTVPTVNTSSSGTVALTAGAATVAATGLTANSQVLLTVKTPSGAIGGQPYVATVTPGTGFTIAGGGGSNAGTYNWLILN